MDEPQQPLAAPEGHPPGRRAKRRLMLAVAGLYLLSLAAACVIILRGSNNRAEAKKAEGSKGGFLSGDADSVGWVAIHGPIYNSEDGRPWEKGSEQWARRIKAMAEAKGVRAIVLDINSPGGSVGAVQELYSQILRVRKEKKIPVVALFDDVSASGGYYIASACDKIVAHPGTLTGSIGVIFSVSNLEGLFHKIGYKMEPIKSGKHKDIGSPARPMTPEEKAILQALIDDAYQQFVAAVSAGRGLPVEQVKPLADGRIFSGRQALQNHLVDALGDSTDAIELAGKLAGLSGRPKVRREGERFSDIFELLDSRAPSWTRGASSALERLFPAPHAGLEYLWPGF